MRLLLIRIVLLSLSFAVFSVRAHASQTLDLVDSCRSVAAATEPARRIWLERDLFTYEMHRALGASGDALRLYRANLRETCARVAHNNAVYQHHRSRMIRASSKRPWLPAS